LAAFQVSTHGRFWVSPEVPKPTTFVLQIKKLVRNLRCVPESDRPHLGKGWGGSVPIFVPRVGRNPCRLSALSITHWPITAA